MKKLLLFFIFLNFIKLLNAQHTSIDTVFITLNFPDPCACDNSTLSELLYIQNLNLQETEDTCFNATQTIYVGGLGVPFIMEQGASSNIIAGQSIIIKPYTHIKAGSYMHASISPGGPFCNEPPSAPQYDYGMLLSIDNNQLSNQDKFFKIYPNPTSKQLNIESLTPSHMTDFLIELYNSIGNKVKTIYMKQSNHQIIDVSDLSSGIYFIVVTGNEFKEVEKLIKS